MTRLRVFQLISSGGFYGAENMAIQLSLVLKNLNHELTIGIFRNAHRPNLELAQVARRSGLQVEMIECRGKVDFGTVASIRNRILHRGIDIVHSHGYKANIYGYLAARGTNVRLVATCHNWAGKTLTMRIYAALDRVFLRGFPAIAAVSNAVQECLVQSGVPRHRTRVVKNGIDTELFSGGRAVLKELPQLRGKKVIGFVGRLAKEKGLAYLVKAVRPIMKEDGNVALVLVGDGPYHDELCGLIKELDLEEHIVILGKRSDLADLYASMDVCVLPSLNEGVPMAVLEAMAAGKPVLATRVGGIPEIIQDGQTGLLIEPADQSQLTLALKRLLVSPELCEELGQRGRDRVCSHFSARGMAQAYLAMYAEAGAESDGIAKAADASPSPNTARPFVIKGGDPKISIIIPALNEENVIGRCLDALEKNDAPRSAFEVIVVDNGSTDRTPDVAMSFENVLTIKVLKVAKVHISAARNRGAAEARGKFLAFLDADCLAPPNWLSSALRLLQESEASIIGAHYGIPDDSTWVGRLWTQDRFASRTGEVSYLPAGDLLVNRETFSSIGGFDESIQTNEDFDLCERARAVGLSVRSHPELKVIHLGTPRTLSAFYRKQRWHGMHVFTVFLRDPDKRKNRRPVLLAIYTVACLAGIMAGVLAALAGASWNISMLSALLLTAPLVGVALTKSVRRRKWSEVIPLALLYLTFSIARARSLLNYKTWKPSHRSSRAGVPV